jgi:hypothetical protein
MAPLAGRTGGWLYAKKWMLRAHLVPFFGAMRLDAIGPAEIEAASRRTGYVTPSPATSSCGACP